MQREVDTVPLMLVDGYQADGWLGMLIGTRMWYGFYGGVVLESVQFEGKVEELCRELGDRARESHIEKISHPETSAAGGGGNADPGETQLASELAALRVKKLVSAPSLEELSAPAVEELSVLSNKDLRLRAKSAGATAEQLEDAADSDNMTAELVALILESEMGFLQDTASAESGALRLQLSTLSNKDLRATAKQAGATAEQLEAAADCDDMMEALVDLITVLVLPLGSTFTMADFGPEACSEDCDGDVHAIERLLIPALEHAVDVLDIVVVSTPRRSRRPLKLLADRVEVALEQLEPEMYTQMGPGGDSVLSKLQVAIEEVQILDLGETNITTLESVETAINRLLDAMERCSDIVMHALNVLQACVIEHEAETRARALEVLRGLSMEPQASITAAEESAVGVLSVVGCEAGHTYEERATALLALWALTMRHNTSYLAIVGVRGDLQVLALGSLRAVADADDGEATGHVLGDVFGHVLLLAAALNFCFSEGAYTFPAKQREGLVFTKAWLMDFMNVVKSIPGPRVEVVIKQAKKMLEADDVVLSCAVPPMLNLCCCSGFSSTASKQATFRIGCHAPAWAVYRRLCPAPLPDSWWAARATTVDVLACQLSSLYLLFGSISSTDHPGAAEGLVLEPWWPPLLREAAHLAKANESGQLSAGSTMYFSAMAGPYSILETAAKLAPDIRDEILLDPSVVSALLYGAAHDFGGVGLASGVKLSAYAVGGAVQLCGRNEQGTVLNREVVGIVLDGFCACFFAGVASEARVVAETCGRWLTELVVSDQNKVLMLENENLVAALVAGLLLAEGDPRRGQVRNNHTGTGRHCHSLRSYTVILLLLLSGFCQNDSVALG
jgi:hypothetical protein